ncbi:MAG: protein kinase [Ectothiorhodospiraceae bacterium]|nr:protein kinase [Ectothiorhodospiraceae bacterium]
MMLLFAKHRWWTLLLGLSLLGWSFMPGAQQLEFALYTRMAQLMPVMKAPDNVVVITLGDDSAYLNNAYVKSRDATHSDSLRQAAHHFYSYEQLAAVLQYLGKAKVAAVGVTVPLDTLQTRIDSKALSQLQQRLVSPGDAAILQQLDPDSTLRSALQNFPEAVLATSSVTELIAGPGGLLNVEAPENTLALVLPLLLPPELHDVSVAASAVSAPLPIFSESVSSALFADDHSTVRAAAPLALSVTRTAKNQNEYGQFLPSFELLLAARALRVPMDSISVHPGQGVMLGTVWYDADAGLRIYPRVRDVSQPITVLSAHHVLEDAAVRKQLRGKTVIVGLANGPLSLLVDVPGGGNSTGLQWSAQVVNAVINESFIRVPYWSLGVQRGALVVIILYLLLLPIRLRGNLGLAMGVGVGFVMLNTSLLLMIVQNTWLPLALPVLLLLSGQVLLRLHHWVNCHHFGLVADRDAALVELSTNLRTQGQFDRAFEKLGACVASPPLREALYQLALDFERRRQFSKALAAYDIIAKQDDNFRDIRERRARHQRVPESPRASSLASTTISYASTKLVVDDPNVERPLLGRYEIESELGRGAMGTVYLGRDPRIGRTVAIKTMALTEEFESEQLEEVRRRFFQEAETAGRLNHPSIVTVYDVGEEHDLAYIAMDYITGNSLEKHIRTDELLSIEQVFSIGIQVAEALGYAHEQKVVHRDVKPGNIIFDAAKSQLKVTDFGIACLTDNSKTRTGTVLGSPFYMSPEQIAGKKVDGRSDLFSLGVTLYQLFTGYLPFEGDSLTSLMYQITHEKPKGIRKLRPELPTCMTRLINKALEKETDKRFATGQAMADAIKRCYEQI